MPRREQPDFTDVFSDSLIGVGGQSQQRALTPMRYAGRHSVGGAHPTARVPKPSAISLRPFAPRRKSAANQAALPNALALSEHEKIRCNVGRRSRGGSWVLGVAWVGGAGRVLRHELAGFDQPGLLRARSRSPRGTTRFCRGTFRRLFRPTAAPGTPARVYFHHMLDSHAPSLSDDKR